MKQGLLRNWEMLAAWWLASLLLAGCSSPTFDKPAQDKVVQEATQMLHDYYASTCAAGLTAEFEYLDSTPDFRWKPLGTDQVLRYDSISAMIRRNIAFVDSTCATWEKLTVTAVARDTARYEGILHVWTHMVAGDTSDLSVQEAGVLIRRDARWRLLSGETLKVQPYAKP